METDNKDQDRSFGGFGKHSRGGFGKHSRGGFGKHSRHWADDEAADDPTEDDEISFFDLVEAWTYYDGDDSCEKDATEDDGMSFGGFGPRPRRWADDEEDICEDDDPIDDDEMSFSELVEVWTDTENEVLYRTYPDKHDIGDASSDDDAIDEQDDDVYDYNDDYDDFDQDAYAQDLANCNQGRYDDLFYDDPSSFEVTLGIGNHRHVHLTDAARQYSLYVIGTPGVGKSTLLENIAQEDMRKRKGLCFLDPHGDSVQKLLRSVPFERGSDVIYWDPKDITAPICLNPFYCHNLDNPLEVDRRVEDFISALSSLQEFTEVFKQAPQMVDILRHLAFACVLNRGTTLLDAPRFLTNGNYRHSFYPALQRYNRRDILEYWEDFDEKTSHRKEQLISSSLNKLRRLSTTSITRSIFQRYTPTINFRDFMDRGKILLVDLSGLGEGNGELIGAFIVFDILRAALSRGDVPEEDRRPFYLFADEFERFMTTAFPRIIDEGRKFKLSSVLAHQHRGQLSGTSIGSTLSIKNKVIFRVNSADAQALAASFDTTPPPPDITGEQSVRTLALDPWQRLFFEEKPHNNPEVNELVERIMLMFYYRGRDMSSVSPAKNEYPKPLSKKYFDKRMTSMYPFFVYTIGPGKSCFEGDGDNSLHFSTLDLTWKTSYKWGDPYLLSCQQGRKDEAALQEFVDKFCAVYLPETSYKYKTYETSTRPIMIDPRNPYFPSTIEHEHSRLRDPDKYKRLHALHVLAKEELQKLITPLLSDLGDLLAPEENHIKTDSGQYEPVYGPLRTYNDMVGEIANSLTQLPRFQARCIIDEDFDAGNKPVEYTLNTLPFYGDGSLKWVEPQFIIDQSRQLSREAQDDVRHDILPERKPADDEPSHPLSGHEEQSPAVGEDDEDDEDDFFR